MCQNVFKNREEAERKADFTKLFVALVTSSITGQTADKKILRQAGPKK